MKKSELKNGDVVEYRNGDYKIFLANTDFGDIITSRDRHTYANLAEYTNDFSYRGDSQYDIIKVLRPKNKFRFASGDYENDYDIIYDALDEAPIELTIAEISRILGRKIEIVG